MADSRTIPLGSLAVPGTHAEEQVEANTPEAVFERLYVAAFPRLFAFVRYQVSSTEAAQEVVSRVFLKAYRHREKIPAGEAGMYWVFRIGYTTLVDYWRVDGRRERAHVPVQEMVEQVSSSPTPELDYQRRRQVGDLLQVVSDLSDDDRAMIALKFAADRTNRDIALILNLSEGAVSMRLMRALRRLKQRLQGIGWDERN